MITISTKQQIEDFTQGCCFYATGGGGPPLFGQKMLLEALDAGKHIRIVDANEISDNAWTVCPYLMGSSGPETEAMRNIMKSHGIEKKTVVNMPADATRLLLEREGISLNAITPLELGGAATASALATAAWLDVPTVDGDFEGRALPEIPQMLPAIHNVDLLPVASADAYGNRIIIETTINNQMMERIGKHLSMASFGLIGQACLLREFNKVRSYLLLNTLSKALSVGTALRQAREKNDNLIETVIKCTGSKILFIGEVVECSAGDLDGYYVGNVSISGIESFKKNELKVWFKNEFILSWLNQNPYIACPDLITMIDIDTGEPIINSQLAPGMRVVVFGLPAPEALCTPIALKMLGPKHFGFYDFEPQKLLGL